jgi:hypothetical protein
MESVKFDLKVCIWKGIKSVLIFVLPVLIAYVNSVELGDKTILQLIFDSVPVLGSLTVAGILTSFFNWLKFSIKKV